MFKKFLFFASVTLLLLGAAGAIAYHYLVPKEFNVFVETYDNGVITVDKSGATGNDSKYRFKCKNGESVTFNINPVRNNEKYFVLDKLTVNGEDATKQVNMLQYRTRVTGKLDIVASFKEGKRPETEKETISKSLISKPQIDLENTTPYLGSMAAYNIKDPSIIFDSKSGYYYAFASNNVVVRSKDLINWEGRTTYFETVYTPDTDAILDFSQFKCVKKWAETHGYSKDIKYSTATNDRNILSPDIIKIGDVYYLYFSLSKAEKANESAIFCVSTTDLEKSISTKKWDECGLVINTCGENGDKNSKTFYDESNAVHPSVFFDDKGGFYMVYGAYCGKDKINGALYLIELDKKTGLLKGSSSINSKGKRISTLHGDDDFTTGTLVAKPGSVPSLSKDQGSLISAADVVYNSDNGYYYLFMTYGVEEKNYNIRVARSKSVDGPYVDNNSYSMVKFDKSAKKNQYTKGFTVIGGYNFDMSSGGIVSYTNVGKASPGSPSVIKTADGKWIMALQSQIYFKINGKLCSGEMAAKTAELNIDALATMETRQLLWTDDGWPIALPQAYANESTKKAVSTSSMYGNWDVVIFDDALTQSDYRDIACSHSKQVSIFGNVAISSDNIRKNVKLEKLNFSKNGDESYNVLIDSVNYKVYPVIVWDWELSTGTVAFVGIGENGNTIWGKKSYSPLMGIYTDTFYFLLDNASEETKAAMDKKILRIKDNPSQSQIDAMVKKMINS